MKELDPEDDGKLQDIRTTLGPIFDQLHTLRNEVNPPRKFIS
jgi:hypothetical protein